VQLVVITSLSTGPSDWKLPSYRGTANPAAQGYSDWRQHILLSIFYIRSFFACLQVEAILGLCDLQNWSGSIKQVNSDNTWYVTFRFSQREQYSVRWICLHSRRVYPWIEPIKYCVRWEKSVSQVWHLPSLKSTLNFDGTTLTTATGTQHFQITQHLTHGASSDVEGNHVGYR